MNHVYPTAVQIAAYSATLAPHLSVVLRTLGVPCAREVCGRGDTEIDIKRKRQLLQAAVTAGTK